MCYVSIVPTLADLGEVDGGGVSMCSVQVSSLPPHCRRYLFCFNLLIALLVHLDHFPSFIVSHHWQAAGVQTSSNVSLAIDSPSSLCEISWVTLSKITISNQNQSY